MISQYFLLDIKIIHADLLKEPAGKISYQKAGSKLLNQLLEYTQLSLLYWKSQEAANRPSAVGSI